jgi:hypothetical protein
MVVKVIWILIYKKYSVIYFNPIKMDITLKIWPYYDIIADIKIPEDDLLSVGYLNNCDLLYYASYASSLKYHNLTDFSDQSLVKYLRDHISNEPDLFIEIFSHKPPMNPEIEFIPNFNYDALLREPIDINIKRLYYSKVFPLVSDCRTSFELVYYQLINIDSLDIINESRCYKDVDELKSFPGHKYLCIDNELYNILYHTYGDGYVDLDLLIKVPEMPNYRYIDQNYRISGSNEILFNNILKIIRKFRPQVISKRKVLPKGKRMAVWDRYFPKQRIGNCLICNDEIDISDKWEAGHIISHSKGGNDNIENLRPICVNCNRSMKATNMNEWALQNYPQSFISEQAIQQKLNPNKIFSTSKLPPIRSHSSNSSIRSHSSNQSQLSLHSQSEIVESEKNSSLTIPQFLYKYIVLFKQYKSLIQDDINIDNFIRENFDMIPVSKYDAPYTESIFNKLYYLWILNKYIELLDSNMIGPDDILYIAKLNINTKEIFLQFKELSKNFTFTITSKSVLFDLHQYLDLNLNSLSILLVKNTYPDFICDVLSVDLSTISTETSIEISQTQDLSIWSYINDPDFLRNFYQTSSVQWIGDVTFYHIYETWIKSFDLNTQQSWQIIERILLFTEGDHPIIRLAYLINKITGWNVQSSKRRLYGICAESRCN